MKNNPIPENQQTQAGVEIAIRRNLRIPMPDGEYLSAYLVMPREGGPFPVVFDYYPYRKDDLGSSSLRQHHALAKRGYAALRLDVRGTGGSPGIAEDEYVLQEQLDGVAAINWLAKQPWSSGEVGMFGMSYGGFNSLQVAMHRPQALKAICPMYFTDNRYTDDCHYKGGALQMLYDMASYGLSMVVQNALPPHPKLAGADWSRIWEQHLQNEPWMIRWLENQTYAEQWKHGSLCEDYAAVQCAVYLFGGWRDGYTNCNLRTFQNLRSPKKLLIGPWLHSFPDRGVPGPRIDHVYEMARFFDFWLKGIDNGVMEEPPVSIYVQQYDPPRPDRKTTSGYWRFEESWPVERSEATILYLNAEGKLTAESVQRGVATYTYHPGVGASFGMFSAASPYLLPADQRVEEAYSLNFTSPVLEDSLEILGHPLARLSLSVDTEIATLVVRLSDVAPDGTSALVTKGILNLTHRESHEQPAAITPGEVFLVELPLDATCWQFSPGHRLRLSISGADFPNTWPSPYLYEGKIYLGGSEASQLVLPVIEPLSAARNVPQFASPGKDEPILDGFSEPATWRAARDYLAGSVEFHLRSASRSWAEDGMQIDELGDTTARVNEYEPARASVRGFYQVAFKWPDRVVEARARGQIESTEEVFQLTVNLEVSMDDLPHFSKNWTRSVPRNLL